MYKHFWWDCRFRLDSSESNYIFSTISILSKSFIKPDSPDFHEKSYRGSTFLPTLPLPTLDRLNLNNTLGLQYMDFEGALKKFQRDWAPEISSRWVSRNAPFSRSYLCNLPKSWNKWNSPRAAHTLSPDKQWRFGSRPQEFTAKLSSILRVGSINLNLFGVRSLVERVRFAYNYTLL